MSYLPYKIVNLKMANMFLEKYRGIHHKIVFTNGCFDILHRGHVEYLSYCKYLGDVVVVGMNSDESVRNLKGEDRPYNNQEDRACVLSALEAVDYVVIFDELDPMTLIESIRPHILVKGEDWKDNVVGQEFVESYGGRVVLAPMTDHSTTKVLEKING